MKIKTRKLPRSIERFKESRYTEYSIIILSLLVSLGVLIIFAVLFGASIDHVIYSLQKAFIDPFNISENLSIGATIIMVALGLTIAFKTGVVNIGAEGQLIVGGLVSAVVAINLPPLTPPFLFKLLPFISGGIAGLLWILPPTILRIRFGINEILTTVLMNYIAFYMVSYLLHGPLWSSYTNFPETDPIPMEARFTRIIPVLRVTWESVLIIIILTLFVYILLSKTALGWKIQVVGSNPDFAKMCGINTSKYIAVSLFISGFLSGLAGAYMVQSLFYKMRMEVSAGYGFTGIITALAGRLNPISVTLVSYFVTGVTGSCTTLALIARLPVGLAYVFQSTLLIIILSYNYIVSRIKSKV